METGLTAVSGVPIRLRSATPSDRDAVDAFYRALSRRSRFFRFLSPQEKPPAGLIESEVGADDPHLTVVAVAEQRVIGVASAFPAEQPELADFSIAVADAEQGRGLGTALLIDLARRSRERGITVFRGETLAVNRRLLGALADAGFVVTPSVEHGVTSLRFAVAASCDGVAASS